ncbi:MAG: sigma-70 family RNA polymerase sigma factor [Pseudomonadota bacterium]
MTGPAASDEDLMRAYAGGDAEAFETLYERYRVPLYRYVLHLCGNDFLGRDLAQDVWMKLIAGHQDFPDDVSFRPYLYRIAHNRVMDEFRRDKVRRAHSESSQAQGNEIEERDPERITDAGEAARRLLSLVDELPTEQREVFLLREEADLSIQEIAQAIGVGVETAKSRLRYAMKKLRNGMSGWL